MAAQTNLLTFTGKIESTEVHIGKGMKTENYEDSSSSVGEPTANGADIIDWDVALGDGANVKAESPERCGASPSREDEVEVEVTDLSNIDESPVQPLVPNFPVSVITGKPRRFTAYWYSKYASWLEYSVEKDAIFCKVCRHFGNNPVADKFTRGFRNWKRTHMACSKHELSKAHKAAMFKYTEYKERQQSSRGTCSSQPGAPTPGLIQSNRDYIRVVLDVVMFCVRRRMAPGERAESETDHFHELFRLLCKYDPKIKSQFDGIPKNKSSPAAARSLPDDLMDAAASLLLRRVKQELHDAEKTPYAILADECADRSERQLAAVCLRYPHKESVRERVVGFVEVGDASADGIALKILQILEPFELDPGLCVGFGFDGLAVMSDAQGVLKRTFPRALAVHRHSQRLSSALCAASRRCPGFGAFVEAVEALGSFLTRGSHARARFLEIQREMRPNEPPVALECDARHQRRLSAVFGLFDVVLETLAEFAERGGPAGLQAQSLLLQLQTKKFAFLLVASCKLFEMSDSVGEGLRSDSLSAAECIDSIQRLKRSLADLRFGGFQQVFSASAKLSDKNHIGNWDVSFSRKRKLPSRSRAAPPSAVRGADDLRALWHQILDSQITELDRRFHPDSFCLMEAAAALRADAGSDPAEKLRPVGKLYGVEVCDAESLAFSQMPQQTSAARFSPLDCTEERFPRLRPLLRVLLALPVSACAEERVRSSVNGVKSAPLTPQTPPPSPLSLLALEKDLTDSLDYDEIIDVFYFIKFVKPFISQGGNADAGGLV